MYITFISSTFADYPFNNTYLSEDLESAREYCIAMMSDVVESAKNERIKRFAGFMINKLKTEKNISFGYGDGIEHIAVECMLKSEYENHLGGSKEYLEGRIAYYKRYIKELKGKCEKLT